MEILNDIYKYANIIYTRLQRANALQLLKHLNVGNIIAVRQNKPICTNNIIMGYGDYTFFNVYTRRYANLQVKQYDEIMLIYYLTQHIIKNFAIFMCVNKKYFDYAKNIINFFNKYNYINYALLENKANAQILFEYKQMLLNYAKLMHKTYVYSKRVNKETLIKLRIDNELFIKNKNFTQNVLIDYYVLHFLNNKQNLKLLSFLSERKQKALKNKIKRRLQKIKNVRINKKHLAKAINIEFDDILNKNKEEYLQIIAAYIVLNTKTRAEAEV